MEIVAELVNTQNITKKKFDDRYINKDIRNNKTKAKGQNERNLTSEQLIEKGLRQPPKETKKRRLGGPNDYEYRM